MICNQVLKSKLKGKTSSDIHTHTHTHTHTPANDRLKAKPCNRQKKGGLNSENFNEQNRLSNFYTKVSIHIQ